MNDASAPLTADQIDELLSADLDGEFDAAALDLGLTVDEARRRLAASPDVEGRRAMLTRARDAMVAPIDGFDELLSARLRSKAVKAFEQTRDARVSERSAQRRRGLYTVAGIAAMFVAVVAVGASVSTGDGDRDSTATAGAPAPSSNADPGVESDASDGVTEYAASPTTPALGEFESATALADAVRRSARAAADAAPTSVAGQRSGPEQGNLDSKDSAGTVPTAAGGSLSSTGCADAGDRAAGADTSLVFMSGATIKRAPVAVRVYRRGADRVLVVLDRDCNLVIRQTFA
jgi:hypothetical protein